MPTVQSFLEQGVLSEWRAMLVTRAVSVLSPELQEVVDEHLASQGAQVVARWGDRQVETYVRALVASLDAEAVLKRMALAAGDRRVSVRPAADGMAYLTGVLQPRMRSRSSTSSRMPRRSRSPVATSVPAAS